ncbi:hypothetical protein HZA97_03050 [Candidatus Woesearchaeota archaeon]|nr:hypothetical protein [Candidatus Woesearchaeota archaeon]
MVFSQDKKTNVELPEAIDVGTLDCRIGYTNGLLRLQDRIDLPERAPLDGEDFVKTLSKDYTWNYEFSFDWEKYGNPTYFMIRISGKKNKDGKYDSVKVQTALKRKKTRNGEWVVLSEEELRTLKQNTRNCPGNIDSMLWDYNHLVDGMKTPIQ